MAADVLDRHLGAFAGDRLQELSRLSKLPLEDVVGFVDEARGLVQHEKGIQKPLFILAGPRWIAVQSVRACQSWPPP